MPTFNVRCDYHEADDGRHLDAGSPREAAERCCREHDNAAAEYPPERTVIVTHPDGREQAFEVECVPVPEYNARAKK